MKIDRSTKIEDNSGSTCELDLIPEGISVRTKNGKPFILATVDDAQEFVDVLFDLKMQLDVREQNVLPGADETEPVDAAPSEPAAAGHAPAEPASKVKAAKAG